MSRPIFPADEGKRPLRQAMDGMMSAFRLRAVDRLGTGAVVTGTPFISNEGAIRIGEAFRLGSRPARSHLIASKGATIEIGDHVLISYGAAISAQQSIRIGDNTRIGPFVAIMDSDFHVAGNRHAVARPSPIVIGNGVVIGNRAIILRGASIGDGVRILGGGVVSGAVPAGAVVGGVPARSIMEQRTTGEVDLPELVMRILSLKAVPKLSDGPAEIPAWDSLGSLKLLLAIEETFGVTLDERELSSVRSVARLSEVVAAARRQPGGAEPGSTVI